MIDPLFCWAFFCLVVIFFELLHRRQTRSSPPAATPAPDPVIRKGRVLSQGCGR